MLPCVITPHAVPPCEPGRQIGLFSHFTMMEPFPPPPISFRSFGQGYWDRVYENLNAIKPSSRYHVLYIISICIPPISSFLTLYSHSSPTFRTVSHTFLPSYIFVPSSAIEPEQFLRTVQLKKQLNDKQKIASASKWTKQHLLAVSSLISYSHTARCNRIVLPYVLKSQVYIRNNHQLFADLTAYDQGE